MKFEIGDRVRWGIGDCEYRYNVIGAGLDSKGHEWYLVEDIDDKSKFPVEMFRDYELGIDNGIGLS